MPLTRHVERHFTSGDTVRDIVIGMSDGLTVPFALAAGLSGAVESTSIVITAGLAEIAARRPWSARCAHDPTHGWTLRARFPERPASEFRRRERGSAVASPHD